MGSNGQRDGEWMVMDGATLWGWTAQWQLDGEAWRDGDLMMMDDEEQRERDGDVNKAGGGSNNCQRIITL